MTSVTAVETFLWWESSTGTLEDDTNAPAGRVEALFTSEELQSPTLTEDEEQALDQALDHLSSALKRESFADAIPEAPAFDYELPMELPYGPVGSGIRIINRAVRAARGRARAPSLRPVVRVCVGRPRFSMHMIRNAGGAVHGVEVQVGGPAIEAGLVRVTDVYIESLTGPRPSYTQRKLHADGPSTVWFDEVVVQPALAGRAEGSERLRLEEEASLIVRLRLEGRRVGSAELHLAIGEPGKDGRRLRREMVVVAPDDA